MTSGPSSYADDLRLAHVLADGVDDLTMERFRAVDLAVETKPDLTPVTEADRAAEESIRAMLGRVRPRDAVLGEEGGETGHGARRWVLDPIDGTKNFVRGVPVWATLIALMDGQDVVVGLVSAPALNRRWWATTGGGTWTGRSLSTATRCRVSHVDALDAASLSYSELPEWEASGRLDTFLDLGRACWRTRAYGDFWSYTLVAEGAVDIACEPELSLWDVAALVPIVTEAGGRVTGLAGGSPTAEQNAVATNGRLHDEVLRRLGPARATPASAGSAGSVASARDGLPTGDSSVENALP